MSKINELILELCPNGVEYKNIKDLCLENFWVMPSTPNYQNEGIPYITSKNIRNGIVMFDDVKYITEEDYKSISNNRPIKENDFLISMIGTIGEVGIVKKEDLPFYGQNMYLLRLNTNLINIKYFYHYFTSEMVRKILLGEKNNGNQGYLKTKNIESLKAPVPPLEVQEEIVRILDKFGELEAELKAELKARKSQYEFWREKLLNNGKYSVVSLGDYATFSQGIQVDPKDQKDYCDDGMVPFLRIVDFVKDDEPPRYIIKPDNKYIKKENEEMIMIRYGASAAGKVFINKYGAIANNMFKINLTTNEIDIKYLWHYLSQDKIYKSLNNTGGGSTMPAINFKMASSIQVVLPPKEEQNRIVKILDKFEELANDITVGLPAEIELRRKQYEYYRNKLLSFEELRVSE